MARTKNKKEPKATHFHPKLKQRQRVLHALKSLVRLVKLGLFCACFYGLYILLTLDFWTIKNIELTGLSKFGSAFVAGSASLEKTYLDQHILTVNPFNVNKNLQNNRLFKDIRTYRSLFPATLHIDFLERTPYIKLFESDSDKDIVIDDEGVVLNYDSKFNSQKKAVYSIKKVKNFKLSSEQLNAIKVIERFKLSKKIIDNQKFDISNPQNIIMNTDKNIVWLGNLDDLLIKIKSIPQIESLSKTTKNELEYIDVRYWQNPVLKLKKGSDSYDKSKKEFFN